MLREHYGTPTKEFQNQAPEGAFQFQNNHHDDPVPNGEFLLVNHRYFRGEQGRHLSSKATSCNT
jgi:hypothetical protein